MYWGLGCKCEVVEIMNCLKIPSVGVVLCLHFWLFHWWKMLSSWCRQKSVRSSVSCGIWNLTGRKFHHGIKCQVERTLLSIICYLNSVRLTLHSKLMTCWWILQKERERITRSLLSPLPAPSLPFLSNTTSHELVLEQCDKRDFNNDNNNVSRQSWAAATETSYLVLP